MSNAASEAVIQEYCRELKLAAVVRDYPGLCRRARDGGWAYEDLLRELLEAEVRNRHQSTARRLLREARFPDIKTLDQLDWSALKGVSRHKPVEGMDDKCLGALMAYRWPGNIRELRNVIERAIVMSQSRELSMRGLPPNFKHREAPGSMTIPFGTSRAEADRQFVFGTIAYTRGNKARAAAMLELSRRGLYKLLERYEDGAPSWRHNGTSHNGRNGTRDS